MFKSKLRFSLLPFIQIIAFDKLHYTIEIGWLNYNIYLNK